MSVDVTTEITINRPVSEVYAFASDPDKAPVWYKNIKSVEWVTEKPLQLGSKVAFVAEFLGKTLKYTYEFVVIQPESQLTMRTSEGPFPMETTYIWEAVGPSGTLMRLRNRGAPSGFSRLVTPFMSLAMRRANVKDLALLKEVLEDPN